MSMESARDSLGSSIDAKQINEFVEKYKGLVIFLSIELFFLVSGFLFGQVTIRIEEQGPALSDIIAGLMGGLAVVWILLGAVTYGVLLLSNLWLRYQREM